MITLEVTLTQNKRGRGFWELKPSFLKQLNYVDEVKTTRKKKVEEEYQQTINPALL